MAESIYNWTEVHQHPPPKPTMYHSKHDGSTNPNNSLLDPFSVTSTYGSIGRDLTEKESPNDFLRSGSLSRPATLPSPSKLPKNRKASPTAFNIAHIFRIHSARPYDMLAAAKFERPEVVPKKPAIPSRTATTKRAAAVEGGSSPKRDFVTENAVEAILASSKRAHPAEAPNWLQRQEFGRVPQYLQQIKIMVQQEADAAARAEEEKQAAIEAQKGRRLSPAERDELLLALKLRWDHVNTQYQKISHKRISTADGSLISEIRCKSDLEKELAQLEADIKKMSTPGPIYVLEE